MKKQFLAREYIVSIIFTCLALLVVFQVIRIQTSEEAKVLVEWSKDNNYEVRTLFPERGRIFDRNGRMLAGNKTVYEVSVTLSQVTDPVTIAMTLNSVLGKDYQATLDLLNDPPKGIISLTLAKYVSSEKYEQLKAIIKDTNEKSKVPNDPNLDGLEFSSQVMRSYPDKTLASNIIGFVNLGNNTGNYGVEQKYDSLLAGVPKKVLVPRDPNKAGEMPKVPAGTDLILTIDREIQAMVENELKAALEESKSVAGTIVVMDPRTGEIMAMASSPQMDLNDYQSYNTIYPSASEFNRAVSMQYEPGSVFKILTMAAAIDSGLVVPSTTYFDPGFYEIGGVNIVNWDRAAYGTQDMVGCLKNSLNVCMARLADLMGEQTFYTYIRRFGIGHPTGIDISNEARGRLKDPADDDWYKVDLGTNSFGQGVAVSPIQMMAAASALANDGKMVYPHVVYAMVSNGIQSNTPVQTLGTPISPQTARTVTDMLASAQEAGNSIALVDGYRTAGKTGTASIPGPNGQYDSDLTNASYIGWGPVDDPKFMVYIWMERPERAEWASIIASPIFHNVVEKLVVLMNLPPDEKRQQLAGQ
jgi:cell division protein FtsI/penicillin-binding protein 2